MKHYKLYPRERYATASTEHPATGTGPDACDSRRRPAPLADGLLSLGQNSTPEPNLHVWLDGQRADFPAIPDLRPNRSDSLFSASVRPPVRGVITRFSNKSRNRFLREMARINASQLAYTMALTLPGNLEFLTHELVKRAFKVMKRRLANVSRFSGVSAFWKLEFQERGAIHYHLILYGLTDDSVRADFQAWVVSQWNSLVCEGLSDEEREEHRWWHARPANMELVRSLSYFAKYVGKSESPGALNARFWGKINESALPFSERSSAFFDLRQAIVSHRLARKRQKKRAEVAEHNAIQARLRKAGYRDVFEMSQADIWRQRSGHFAFNGVGFFPGFMDSYRRVCASIGIKNPHGQARLRSRRRNKTAPIIFTDPAAPKFAQDVVRWVSENPPAASIWCPKYRPREIQFHETPQETPKQIRRKIWKDLTPCPLKPVPPGRMPVSRNKSPEQSDFLEGFRPAPKPNAIPWDDELPVGTKRRFG